MRLIDSCITELKAQGPSRRVQKTCRALSRGGSTRCRGCSRGARCAGHSINSQLESFLASRAPTPDSAPFFFFTLVTGPTRRSLSLTLSDTGVYEPEIRARTPMPPPKSLTWTRTGSTASSRFRSQYPPWRQPRGKTIVSLVNSHTNATSKRWHLWEIDLSFAPGLPPGWYA